MLLDSVPSIWASIHGWYTPAVFFVLLNLVIGTIAVTSTRVHRTKTSAAAADGGGPTGKLSRLPSLVLDRIKSFNVSPYQSQNQETQQETLISRVPSLVLGRIKSFKLPSFPSQNQEALKIAPTTAAVEVRQSPPVEESHISRSRSDTGPAAGEILKKLPKKMKRSASAKSAFANFKLFEAEEDVKTVEDRRPATARAAPSAVVEEEEETGEVDARADVFINMFRNQLKLQRIDSFVKYEEMIKRGGNS